MRKVSDKIVEKIKKMYSR